MTKILIVDDDPLLLDNMRDNLASDGHGVRTSLGSEPALKLLQSDAFDLLISDHHPPFLDGLHLIRHARQIQPLREALPCILITAHGSPENVLGALRERVNDFLAKPFLPSELLSSVAALLSANPIPAIEVLSSKTEWVDLRVPCCLAVVPLLQKLLAELRGDFPEETREAIAFSFREMISNAIEYGGRSDPSRYVSVSCVRLDRAILFRIGDPGDGFDPSTLEHAAVSNPSDDLLRHAVIRNERGLRPGGFGILMTKHLVDELVYNEQRNEVLFVKYLW
jgi:CheY-like chemotaxis protein/anti-sigma regulatory factor (Ser/Thr protein kinase)